MLQRMDLFPELEPFLPSKDEHFSKAIDNQRFAESLLTTTRAEREWGIVARFYSALHFIEAYLSIDERGTSSHESRRDVIRALPELHAIAYDYRDLQNLAWNARYLCGPCTLNDVFLS